MTDSEEEWAELARRDSSATMTAAPQPAPPAAAAEAPRGKAKKEKAPKVKAAKAPKPARARGGDSLLSLADGPTRQQLEQEAAAELTAALAPSFELLRTEVPDASNPEDAYRKIESKLDRLVPDRDSELPNHPIYSGDALVYYQLRRHYGSPHQGSSFRRSWYPLSGG